MFQLYSMLDFDSGSIKLQMGGDISNEESKTRYQSGHCFVFCLGIKNGEMK